jgi:hypothetical protein
MMMSFFLPDGFAGTASAMADIVLLWRHARLGQLMWKKYACLRRRLLTGKAG